MCSSLTFAIGDIHGRADLLEAIHAFISDFSGNADNARIIYLGDICDRGPQTKKCMNMISRMLDHNALSTLIRGNHDDWFLRAVRDEDDMARIKWVRCGGAETLLSYMNTDLPTAMDVVERYHSGHLDMVSNAEAYVVEGNALFTHAGVRPDVALQDQDEYDMMWIREEFTDHVGHLSHIVVHGHSVVGERPVVTENRISIDTGAYETGRLTVAVIDWLSERVRFFQTDGDASRVIEVDAVYLDRGLGFATDHLFADQSYKMAA